MSLADMKEMKEYLEALKGNGGLAALLTEECKALAEADRDTVGVDWADLPGTYMLSQYWLAAESEQQQSQLGHISNPRARAPS